MIMKNNNFFTFFSSKKLPLFCGLFDDDKIKMKNIPQSFPFVWGLNLKYGIFQQKPNRKLDRLLPRIYESDISIALPPGVGDFGEDWSEAVLKALLDVMGNDFRGKHVLEIGCSNGFILKKLSDLGAIVVGIEPGCQGKMAREKFSLDIKSDYFEKVDLKRKFDFIYSINVLEHILDLDSFIKKILTLLKDGGLFFAGVPDSSMEMSIGNPNIFLHEHWWYFTLESIKLFFEQYGLVKVRTSSFLYSGNFFVCGKYIGKKKSAISTKNNTIEKLKNEAQSFIEKMSVIFSSMQRHIDKARSCKGKIGLYGASNAINFLGLLNWENCYPKLYDSDSAKHGKYLLFNEYSIRVEPPDSLREDLPTEIWILPVAHQVTIKDFLLSRDIAQERLFLLSDFLNKR